MALGILDTKIIFDNLVLCYRQIAASKDRLRAMNANKDCCRDRQTKKIWTDIVNAFGKEAPKGRIVWVQWANIDKSGEPEVTVPASKVDPKAFDLSSDAVFRAISSVVPRRFIPKPTPLPNFDFKIWDESSGTWWGADDTVTGRKVSAIGSLVDAINKGKKLRMEENYYCVMCEAAYKK